MQRPGEQFKSFNPRTNPRFRTVYRGLSGVTPDDIDTSNVGPHWSADPGVAWNFALNRDTEGNVHWDEDGEPQHGTIVSAFVHKRHIVNPGTDEYRDWSEGENVLGPDSTEREHTVRPGAPVYVQQVVHDADDMVKPVSSRFKEFKRWRA